MEYTIGFVHKDLELIIRALEKDLDDMHKSINNYQSVMSDWHGNYEHTVDLLAYLKKKAGISDD